MDLAELVRELRRDPQRFLECVSPIYLDALLRGYAAIDRRASQMMGAVSFDEGPVASLSVCGRMYLIEPNSRKGVEGLLEKFADVLHSSLAESPVRQSFAGRRFADAVAEVVKQGRPALLFGEPALSWMYHFSVGFDLAFEEFDRLAAEADREDLRRFAEWLSARYGWKTCVPWHRLLRIYEGEHMPGLEAFVRLWDEFAQRA